MHPATTKSHSIGKRIAAPLPVEFGGHAAVVLVVVERQRLVVRLRAPGGPLPFDVVHLETTCDEFQSPLSPARKRLIDDRRRTKD